MKRGRDVYAACVASPDERMKLVRGLKAADLDALIHYAEGLDTEEMRDEVIGLAVIVAAFRYFARARKKQMKKAKKVL